MKLSDTTLTILKNFASINQGIKITEGNTLSTISPLKTLLSKATIADSFDKNFCIYDLNRFLSTLSLFKDPELQFSESAVVIKDGTYNPNVGYQQPNMYTSQPRTQGPYNQAYNQYNPYR